MRESSLPFFLISALFSAHWFIVVLSIVINLHLEAESEDFTIFFKLLFKILFLAMIIVPFNLA